MSNGSRDADIVVVADGWHGLFFGLPLALPNALDRVYEHLVSQKHRLGLIVLSSSVVACQGITRFGNNAADPKKARFISPFNIKELFSTRELVPDTLYFYAFRDCPVPIFMLAPRSDLVVARGRFTGHSARTATVLKNGVRPSIELWSLLFPDDAFGKPVAPPKEPPKEPLKKPKERSKKSLPRLPPVVVSSLGSSRQPLNVRATGPPQPLTEPADVALERLMAAAGQDTRALQYIEWHVNEVLRDREVWYSPMAFITEEAVPSDFGLEQS